MCNNYQKISELDGLDIVECDECYKVALVLPNGDFETIHMCEMCNEWYRGEPVPYPDPDSKHHLATFCSDDCAEEAYQEVVWGEREFQREYEMYGNDPDSWYR